MATPEIEPSWCHTASYTCAVATIEALHGGDVSGLVTDRVRDELTARLTRS